MSDGIDAPAELASAADRLRVSGPCRPEPAGVSSRPEPAGGGSPFKVAGCDVDRIRASFVG